VASDSEKILNDSLYRPESLRLSHGFEPSHLSLTLSNRFMRDFSPIVGVALRLLTFQQLTKESFGRSLIPTGWTRISITSSSWLTARHKYFADLGSSRTVRPGARCRPPPAVASASGRIRYQTSDTTVGWFVADGDAPLCQKIFHISKAQAECVVEPNSMANDIRWKSISVISGLGCLQHLHGGVG
jgi:hypothetical protein